jgi:predicted ATPase
MELNLEKGLNILIGKNGSGKSNLLFILNEALRFTGLSKDIHLKAMSFKMCTYGNEDTFEVMYERKQSKDDGLESNYAPKFYFHRSYKMNGSELVISRRRGIGSIYDEEGSVIQPSYRLYNYALRQHNILFPNTILLGYSLPQSLEFIEKAGKIILDYDLFEARYNYSLTFINRFIWKLENNLITYFDDIVEGELEAETIASIDPDIIRSSFVIDENLIEALSKYTPIKNIRYNSNINIYYNGLQVIIENIKIDFFVNETWLPWSHLSDGTKRLFYIVSEIQIMEEGIILLEEPELGIHPHQFHLLMQFLKERSEYNQIILSTHSPLALNHLDSNELDRIVIAHYSKDTGTQIRKLSIDEQEKANNYVEEVGYLSDYWVHSDLEE